MTATTIDRHDQLRQRVSEALTARNKRSGTLAREAGLTRAEVRHWLRGDRGLRSDKLLAVIETLGGRVELDAGG